MFLNKWKIDRMAELLQKQFKQVIWNSIPDQIKEAENVQTFKTRLKYVHQTINDFTFQKELTGFLNTDNDLKYY